MILFALSKNIKNNDIEYGVDETNFDMSYVRNDIRHNIVFKMSAIEKDKIVEEINKLNEEKELIKQQLQVYMANSTEGYTGNYKVTWRNQERSVLDSKRLQLEHPEIYNNYLKKSYSRPFKITKKEA